MSNKIYTYEGKKYIFVEDMEVNECDRCALQQKCHNNNGLICRDVIGIDSDDVINHRFEELPEDIVTEDKAYEDYQERRSNSNNRGEQLAWAYIVLLAAQLISNHSFIEFYVGAACGLLYLLLSMLQATRAERSHLDIKRDDIKINDYPDWVGGWAWVFYYAKIILLTVGTCYVAARLLAVLS